jgi:quinol monooxygenase YgiN
MCPLPEFPAAGASHLVMLDRKGETTMFKAALLVRLEAKPGKEKDVMAFLEAGLALANQEPTTPLWFALRLGPTTFGVFDAFTDESGRQAHLSGPIAQALMAKAPELFDKPPVIEAADVLGAKLSA